QRHHHLHAGLRSAVDAPGDGQHRRASPVPARDVSAGQQHDRDDAAPDRAAEGWTMAWALLHDRDNWLRNGQANISSTPTPVVGFPSAALRDGMQAAYFRAASITNKTISIAPTQAWTLRYFAAHDLRLHGVVALTGAKLEARVVQTWHTLREWTPAEIEAADWSFGWVGELENIFEVRFS